MQHFDFPKFLFYSVIIVGTLGASFSFGLYSADRRTVIYETVRDLKKTVELAIGTVTNEVLTLANIHPEHFLQPARYAGSGVTVNKKINSNDLILLSGFFDKANELRLIQRNGDIVARWPVRFSEIFPAPSHLTNPPVTDWNIDIHGALILSDGSVVFNFEYGGLVKLDRCGNLVWTLDKVTHHSIEKAENGGFWVPGRRHFSGDSVSPYPPFETPFYEDTLIKVSESGQVITEISVPELFYKNDFEAILSSTGENFSKGSRWDNEIVHLNKIDVLQSDIAGDFPMFNVGDLALSLRQLNLVMVINPTSGDIKWLKVGPWLRQHDPEFKLGGTISIFNNNIYRNAFNKDSDISHSSIPRVSNIVEIDPVSNEYSIIYGNKSQQRFLSVVRGKHEVTADGGLLITEFEGGRVFETNTSGNIVWEYINRYSQQEVGEITEARVYTKNYFNVSDWSCI
ncbi:MAG: arylsulfotransferase family protein [Pseudomonadales bacterium]|nr:arylsulfotransferase family protein [Pseudomonadales bacterium]NRA16387.1 aryl-sulfate sulfotransferase [Oceanospirillaceae bacterium]